MELASFISLFHGWFFLVVVFTLCLFFVMFKGRQNLINLIMGMYLGLLLYEKFPYFKNLLSLTSGEKSAALVELMVFFGFSLLATWLFSRLMPREYLEGVFETIGIKILLAMAATVFIFTLSVYFLPLDVLINTGTPLPNFLTADNYYLFWMMIPLVVLFFI